MATTSRASKEWREEAGASTVVVAVFALLRTVGYHLVALFVQLVSNEYSTYAWHLHF